MQKLFMKIIKFKLLLEGNSLSAKLFRGTYEATKKQNYDLPGCVVLGIRKGDVG